MSKHTHSHTCTYNFEGQTSLVTPASANVTDDAI